LISQTYFFKIFFVPDSNLEIKNSFGRVVLKSHQVGSNNSNEEDLNAQVNLINDFGFVNSAKHVDSNMSQILRSNTQRYNYDDSNRRNSIQNPKRTSSMHTPIRNSYQPTFVNQITDTSQSSNKNEQVDRAVEVVKTKSFIPGKTLLEQSNNNQSILNKIANNQGQQSQKTSQHINSSFDKSRLKRIDFLKSLSQEREKF
jgi:hypothetical protein